MAKGVIRHVDGLGRIVIPKEMRRSFDINEGDLVDIYPDGNTIRIRKAFVSCVCCGSENEKQLQMYNGIHLCGWCLKEFKKIFSQEDRNE